RSRASLDSDDGDDDSIRVKRNRRRNTEQSEEEEEEYASPQDDDIDYQDHAISNRYDLKKQKIEKLSFAFIKILIGFENKYQILNKKLISKIIESEDERGQKIQFKKDLMPRINSILNTTFGMKLVELPPKLTKSTKSQKQKQKQKQKDISGGGGGSSEEYIIISELKPHLKDVIYNYFKSSTSKTNIPHPDTNLIQQGLRMLIISIIIMNENHLTKQELLIILKKKFKLSFKETKSIMISNLNISLNFSTFLQLMVKYEYLNQIDNSKIVNSSSNTRKKNQVVVQQVTNTSNSSIKNVDDKLLELSIGRRTLTEISKVQFIDFLKEVYGEWNEDLNKSALITIDDIWK
ncbi:hypothetical protein CANARDRAFT_180424, partial [[Candida] arabinofermentans NRRL YB-2248]